MKRRRIKSLGINALLRLKRSGELELYRYFNNCYTWTSDDRGEKVYFYYDIRLNTLRAEYQCGDDWVNEEIL